MKNIHDDNGVINLAEGILHQAKEDYINAILLKDYRDDGKPRRIGNRTLWDTRDELERFFRSDWFASLTLDACDGDAAARSVRQEALNRYYEIKDLADGTDRGSAKAKRIMAKMKSLDEIKEYCNP